MKKIKKQKRISLKIIFNFLFAASIAYNNNFIKNLLKFYKYLFFNNLSKIFIKPSKIIMFILKYYLKINKNLKFCYYKISGNFLSSNIILNYLIIQLKKKFRLFEVINPLIITLLRYNKNLLGFKIMCCGRFTRKQIATYYWTIKGKISLSNSNSLIDYSQGVVVLKNSLCGIKIWLENKISKTNLDLKKKKNLYYYE